MIPIGNACGVTLQLKKLGIRQCAFPFDWVRTDDLDDITVVINNNFDNFVSSVEKIGESDKFPVFGATYIQDVSIIMVNIYGIKFYHDFTKTTSLETIIEKYDRRIHRFYEYIHSNDKVCFVRDALKPKKITEDKIRNFIAAIHKINNNCIVELIVIIHNPKKINYGILQCNIENVKVLNDTNNFGDWTRPNFDWQLLR